MAHANPLVFARLVAALQHPAISIFCHVDAKAESSPFEAQAEGRVRFLSNRFGIFWGGYSMIEAELALFRAAREEGPFAGYALISGDSLPLLENQALVEVLGKIPHLLSTHEQLPANNNYLRFERIYLPDTSIGHFRNKGYIERYLDPADLPLIARAIQVHGNGFRKTLRYFKGSQWFAISDNYLSLMLDYLEQTPDYEETFRFTAMPDESFFPTLLRIVVPDAPQTGLFMGVDWTRPVRPYTLTTEDDFANVYPSNAVFYRKFSDQGLDLIDKVLAHRISLERLWDERRPLARQVRKMPH